MTMLARTAALLLIAAAAAASPGEVRAQNAQPAATRWICFYSSELYPEMEPIGFLEDDGGHCPFVRYDPSYGQMYFVRRVPWD
ncbi:hypothetical protein GLE_0491 [Lysobacter enzymogenes]|uniref:Uncharacterized protein n=1 Tax=Lysobacter enzymogenes TaxID=69 RepID=A0A0S2DBE7_LYSEN|nr:hypothetical protein [Lysobacter enzymogenes]ALN55849.1 hypothetical protein GLE_0491 [Lysobacter enzymogenes]QCW24827.1 hypothetical protein FE772_03195 [Lysobacter enzymogenes]